MNYIEKLNLQTEEIEEVETLENHTIINSGSVNKYNGHTREFLAIDEDYNDGFNQLNETNGLGISCNVSKEVKEARIDVNGVIHKKLKDRIDNEVNEIKSSLDNNVLSNFILGNQLLNGHGTKLGINNTIQAYEFLANTKCYDMLEADVHCTIDGVWVCIHDDDISINTNGIGLISKMMFETTQIADVVNGGNNINKFPKMKIPKLEDFINICLQYSLVPMIEIKCSMTDEKYNSLLTLIRRLGVENKVIITAYNQNVIQKLRKMTTAAILWLIPSDRDISDSDITFAKNLGKCGLGGYQYKLSKPQIEKCKENNVFTYIWTISQQFELEIAKEMGANIIGSDNVLRG